MTSLAKKLWVFVGTASVLSLVACGGSEPNGAGSTGTSSGSGGSAGTGGSTGSGSGSGGTGSGTGGSASGSGGNASGGSSGGTGGAGGTGGVASTDEPEGLRWVGRVDATDPANVKFAWQGAGFVANVTGASITVKLQVSGSSTIFFMPVVDGTVGERFSVEPGAAVDVNLASGLDEGVHLVELYRETEGYYGVSSFLGFTEGTLGESFPSSGRLIEVVGDSISAGYGNLGSEVHPNWVADPACHWTAENSSWYDTYAAVAGRSFGAEVSTVARSGWGMVRDNGGSTANVLSAVYGNALGHSGAAWNFERQASAVVINLGTNDWANGDPGADYETAYAAFIATVRGHYPDAYIFLTIGSMLGEPELGQVKTHLANVVATVNDPKVLTFDFGTQNLGPDGSVPTGCDWHPNVAEHARMAGILEQQLTTHLGW